MKMYSYTKKNNHRKARIIGAMTFVLAVAAVGVSYFLMQNHGEDTPVSTNEVSVPVIALPKEEESAKRPYSVEASVVLDYYDGSETDVPSMTKFEGTYRANQGIDYAANNEAFDVLAILSGEVTEIKEDPLFGHTCKIQSGDLTITYQSLKDMKYSVGDSVKQGDVLSLASTNIYNKDLGNHLHIVVEQNGVRMDPENIYGKTLADLK